MHLHVHVCARACVCTCMCVQVCRCACVCVCPCARARVVHCMHRVRACRCMQWACRAHAVLYTPCTRSVHAVHTLCTRSAQGHAAHTQRQCKCSRSAHAGHTGGESPPSPPPERGRCTGRPAAVGNRRRPRGEGSTWRRASGRVQREILLSVVSSLPTLSSGSRPGQSSWRESRGVGTG